MDLSQFSTSRPSSPTCPNILSQCLCSASFFPGQSNCKSIICCIQYAKHASLSIIKRKENIPPMVRHASVKNKGEHSPGDTAHWLLDLFLPRLLAGAQDADNVVQTDPLPHLGRRVTLEPTAH